MGDRVLNVPKVLMIAYFFPPIGGSGALRPMKLAKYLPDYGWLPVILSVKNPDWYYAYDPDLLNELPDKIPVYRSRMLRSAWLYRMLNPLRVRKLDRWIRQWLLHPDAQIGWIPSGVSYGMHLARRFNIKAIYSTSAPISCHLIAYFIKKKTGLPWIADFRDEWYENPVNHFPTEWHSRMHYRLEWRIVRHADHVIAAAPGFCEFLRKHSPDKDKISTLTMGFDPEDFESKKGMLKLPEVSDRFTIAFSGLFYDTFRPTGFLNALKSLIIEGKIPRQKIKILFVGANDQKESMFKDDFGVCSFTGFVSHRQSIEMIRRCDALLLLLSRERGGYVIPSKTYEYMASGKPILALVPADGAVASVIKKTGTGIVVDFDDVEGIRSAVVRLYNQWKKHGDSFKPDENEIKCFNQKRVTRRFAELLDRVTLK